MAKDSALPWVAASGVLGARTIKAPLVGIDTAKPLTVRMYFCEPEGKAPGTRVFDVSVEGKPVGTLDIAHEVGPMRTLVKELTGVRWAGGKVGDQPVLTVTLTPRQGETTLSGIEVVDE
jgi:hypothetical protein